MTGRTELPRQYPIHKWQPSKPKQNHKNHIYYIDTLSCHHCGLPLKQHLIPHSSKHNDDDDTSLFLSLKKISNIGSRCSGDYGHDDDDYGDYDKWEPNVVVRGI